MLGFRVSNFSTQVFIPLLTVGGGNIGCTNFLDFLLTISLLYCVQFCLVISGSVLV
jgi:hypothetical protein